MIKMPSLVTVTGFWLLVLIHLVAIQYGFSWLHLITKPLLMPALLLILLDSGARSTGKKMIVTGLLFSWLGDIFLLFESCNPLFFIAGLASFLITHACYIIFFLSIRSIAPSFLKRQPLFILLIPGYGTGLVWLLFPNLGPLKIPVTGYAAVICIMLLCSIHIYKKVKAPANKHFVSGAILFVLSDSILAVNKFYHPLPFAGVLLMLSYCAAQYFIVRGLLENGK
jgi:uncharacterized membrane protein YhhN